MKAPSVIIQVEGVDKRFGSFQALRHVDLELMEGEFFSLLGPSGCGKSTLLRLIAGFEEPSSGEIRIDGEPMSGVAANRRPTNMVFQSYAIFPHLNVADNVAFGLRTQGLDKAEREARVAEALAMVDLPHLGHRKARELSGGQRQRVALARALVLRPKVLLLDEPLSALDKKLRENMQLELRRLQRQIGLTFLMVTHDQYEAMTMSDRIGVMFDGRLEQIDTPANLYQRPRTRRIADFIGGMNFLEARPLPDGNGRLRVELPAFGTLSLGGPRLATTPGQSFEVGVRPEQATISKDRPAGADHDARARGRVSEVAFYGEAIHYHVRLEGFETPFIVAETNYFHRTDHLPDETVWVSFHSDSVIPLQPAEPAP